MWLAVLAMYMYILILIVIVIATNNTISIYIVTIARSTYLLHTSSTCTYF